MDIKKFKMYLKGKSSPEELSNFKDWLGSGESKEQLSHLMKQIDDKEHLDNEQLIENNLWKRINDRLEIEEIISSISKEHKKQQKRLDKSRGPYAKDGQARKNVRTSVILVAMLVVSVALAFVFNNLNDRPPESVAELVKKSTEKGQKLTLHLNDGTKVMLNSNSEIIFPRSFEGNTREVNVKGEVFFDVSHNERKPFIVHAGKVNAKVLGTSFNFQYFPEKDFNRISLVTGKVQVNIDDLTSNSQDSEFILEPGEEIRIQKDDGKVVKDHFDIEYVTSWKNGTLVFEYASLEEVIKALENWYGIDIRLMGKPSYEWKLTAKFSNENLENVLQSLSHSQGIKYSIDGKNVKIKF